MKKLTTLLFSALLFVATVTKAQTNAMDFNRMDCNGKNHHLFSDLDSGKAVVLFFYMPSCGSCPPPAKKVQAMMKNINKQYPGAVKAYAMPYNNGTACSSVKTWVTTNGLSFYAPLDSGAAQVAYYGGFGMPTVVLVGGKNHRTMFATQSFSTSDTTTMRDSILSMMGISGINTLAASVSSINVYPNPTNEQLTISLNLKENANLSIEIVDITGKTIAHVMNEKVASGAVSKQFNTASLATGNYLLRINANGQVMTEKLTVTH